MTRVYLLDTNIWLELLLRQKRAAEVKEFLEKVPASELSLSDFSLHSIGVILGRSGRITVLEQFASDLFAEAKVTLRSISGQDIHLVTTIMKSQGLDFDDAYQYALAKREQLVMVSFDTDFDKTDLRRQTPADILKGLG